MIKYIYITDQEGTDSENCIYITFKKWSIGELSVPFKFFEFKPSCSSSYRKFIGDILVKPLKVDSDHILATLIYMNELELRGSGYVDTPVKLPKIDLPYLPYARQDRSTDNECFSLKAFLKMMKGYTIECLDKHSCTFLEEAEKVFSEYPKKINTNLYDYIIFPDFGALQRYSHMYLGDPCLHARKERNEHGVFISFDDFRVKAKRVIVIDDICDGGRTFIELGKRLHELGCFEVDLHVSHGIFSQGKEELNKYYKNITCENNLENLNI